MILSTFSLPASLFIHSTLQYCSVPTHTHTTCICRHCSVYIHTGTQEAWVEPTLLWGIHKPLINIMVWEGVWKVSVLYRTHQVCVLLSPTTKWFLLTSVNTHVWSVTVHWSAVDMALFMTCMKSPLCWLLVYCWEWCAGYIMSMHHGQAKYGAALI